MKNNKDLYDIFDMATVEDLDGMAINNIKLLNCVNLSAIKKRVISECGIKSKRNKVGFSTGIKASLSACAVVFISVVIALSVGMLVNEGEKASTNKTIEIKPPTLSTQGTVSNTVENPRECVLSFELNKMIGDKAVKLDIISEKYEDVTVSFTADEDVYFWTGTDEGLTNHGNTCEVKDGESVYISFENVYDSYKSPNDVRIIVYEKSNIVKACFVCFVPEHANGGKEEDLCTVSTIRSVQFPKVNGEYQTISNKYLDGVFTRINSCDVYSKEHLLTKEEFEEAFSTIKEGMYYYEMIGLFGKPTFNVVGGTGIYAYLCLDGRKFYVWPYVEEDYEAMRVRNVTLISEGQQLYDFTHTDPSNILTHEELCLVIGAMDTKKDYSYIVENWGYPAKINDEGYLIYYCEDGKVLRIYPEYDPYKNEYDLRYLKDYSPEK